MKRIGQALLVIALGALGTYSYQKIDGLYQHLVEDHHNLHVIVMRAYQAEQASVHSSKP